MPQENLVDRGLYSGRKLNLIASRLTLHQPSSKALELIAWTLKAWIDLSDSVLRSLRDTSVSSDVKILSLALE